MPEHIAKRPDFEEALEREVRRILADPAFERAPVQSRLLEYLCDQTIQNHKRLTQFAIAVDGLGKPEDYDLFAESYPRVQISRLRQSLASYYARHRPEEGMCVFIRPGDYKLRLGSFEHAYPNQHERIAGIPPLPPEIDSGADMAGRPGPGRKPGRAKHFALIALAGALLASGSYTLWAAFFPKNEIVEEPPLVSLAVTTVETPTPSADLGNIGAAIRRSAGNLVGSSFIVRLADGSGRQQIPDYTIDISLGTGTDEITDARVMARDGNDNVLYTSKVNYDGNLASFLRRIDLKLHPIVGLDGIIAQTEMKRIPAEPRSGYECFLRTETGRIYDADMERLISFCLEHFAGSNYRAYWLARKSGALFRAQLAQGHAIEREGPAWNTLQSALRADRFNTYANYIAAMVELANGQCKYAEPFADRAFDRGVYHPALTASLITQLTLCGPDSDFQESWKEKVEEMAGSDSIPQPALKVHIMFAAIAIDRPDLAERIYLNFDSQAADTLTRRTAYELNQSLKNSSNFIRLKQKLQRDINVFLWNENTRRKIMNKIEAAAHRPRML